MTKRSAETGFTLIEVMVAVAIVAVTLGAGFKAASSLVSNAERLTDVSAAQWCADNQLSAFRLSGQTPDIGDADFSCEELGRTYSGHVLTRPTPNPNFRRLDVRISDNAGRPLLTLSTVLGK